MYLDEKNRGIQEVKRQKDKNSQKSIFQGDGKTIPEKFETKYYELC